MSHLDLNYPLLITRNRKCYFSRAAGELDRTTQRHTKTERMTETSQGEKNMRDH